MGSGYQEKYYQKALAKEFEINNVCFKEQVPIRINHKGVDLGIYYFDFIIDGKIVVEIKNSSKFYIKDIKQVLGYLRSKNMELGILICFSKNGVMHKRILRVN